MFCFLIARGGCARRLPLYLKSHSWGEFVFDFAWAEAYHRAGLHYYPRLVAAVPFTPATGPRFLAADDGDRVRLLAGARALLNECNASSLHVLFPAESDREFLVGAGLMPRLDCQFQWRNDGYGSFDDFLAGFTAEKRKKLKRERRRIKEAGIECRTVTGRRTRRGDDGCRVSPARNHLRALRACALPQPGFFRRALPAPCRMPS